MEGKCTSSKKKFIAFIFFVFVLLANTKKLHAQSLQLNGTNQYGRVTNNTSLQLGSFTIEMWIKPEGTGGTVSANGTGSGGVLNAIPLLTKGIAENESAAIDVNYYLGIKQNGANWNLIADFE